MPVPIPYSLFPALQPLQHIGDQGTREFTRQTLLGRGTLIEKCSQVGGGLVLLTEGVVLVFIEHPAVAIRERNRNHHRNEETGRLLRRRVVGQRRNCLRKDGAV